MNEIKKGEKFYFNNNVKEDYIVTETSDETISYKSVSGTHTFAACSIKDNFYKNITKIEIEHIQV